MHDPFMAMSFLGLEVIPSLKLTDLGLVDDPPVLQDPQDVVHHGVAGGALAALALLRRVRSPRRSASHGTGVVNSIANQ